MKDLLYLDVITQYPSNISLLTRGRAATDTREILPFKGIFFY